MVVVRDARPQDAHAISRIGRASMPAQYAGLVDTVAVDTVANESYEPTTVAACIESCERAGDAAFLVAEVDDAVVGFLHYDSFALESELHRIYIDDRFRGDGVGAALVDALHKRLNPDTYILHVVKGNDGAVRFYERQGLTQETIIEGVPHYEELGVRFPSNPKPFQMIVMRYRRDGPRQ